MYYYIKGKLTRLCNEYAVVETGGIGYKLFVTQNTRSRLEPLFEKEVLLYTYLNIREDAQELYGFFTEEEQKFFVKLLSVSGVGPKAAGSVLSVFTPDKLSFAVSSGDAKAISKANGVGLKTAQKIIIELKGKLNLEEEGESSGETGISDAVNALTVLGYTKAEALAAIKGIDPNLPLEEIITAAFKKLNRF